MTDNSLSAGSINHWHESAVSSISTLSGFFLSFLTVLSITHYLPSSEVGLYFFCLAIVYLCVQIPKGIGTAIRKKVSSTDSNKERINYLNTSLLLLLFSLIAVGLLSPLLILINNFTTGDITISSILIVNLTVYGYSILVLGRSYLAGVGKPGLSSTIKNYGGNGLKLLFITIYLYFSPKYEVALLSYSIGYAIAGILCLKISLTGYEIRRPKLESANEIISFTRWSVPNTFVNDLYSRFDTILLGLLIGSIAVSYYSVPLRYAYFGSLVSVGITTSMDIKLSGLYESGGDVSKIFRESLGASTLVVYPLLAITVVNPEVILSSFFGSEYTPAKYFIIGLTGHRVLSSYRRVAESGLNATNNPNRIILPSLVAIAINIVTAIPLVLYMGGIGVVISTIVSDIARLVYLIYNCNNIVSGKIYHPIMIKQFAIFVAITVLLYLFDNIFLSSDIVLLSIVSVFVFTLYYVLLYIVSDLFRDIISEAISPTCLV